MVTSGHGCLGPALPLGGSAHPRISHSLYSWGYKSPQVYTVRNFFHLQTYSFQKSGVEASSITAMEAKPLLFSLGLRLSLNTIICKSKKFLTRFKILSLNGTFIHLTNIYWACTLFWALSSWETIVNWTQPTTSATAPNHVAVKVHSGVCSHLHAGHVRWPDWNWQYIP